MTYFLSIAILATVFAVATATPINMGLLAFAGAFIVAGVSGISIDDVLGYFPGDLFVIIGGITLLFALAKANGTIDLVVESSLRLVRGKRWAVVWMMYFLAGLLMALGALVATAMLAPIAMSIASKNKINPFLMAMAISIGAISCALSPITIYGAFLDGLMRSYGFTTNPFALFAIPFVLNLGIFVIVFAIYGRGTLSDDNDHGGLRDPMSGGHPGKSFDTSSVGGVTGTDGYSSRTVVPVKQQVDLASILHEADVSA
ncbi:SLC13 family permease [Rhodococcoides yunnanense]|uniref:SLC13 family permease n=1 Tax=Rhodococcoides yunnanense TaxID=278209 RepID=UPI0022B1FFB0|nr:SLC13 family permease [Rhodococcus yunnanensis]MCZ4278769.1 SLC13 family permease [Rhodococcus yunnanensis]